MKLPALLMAGGEGKRLEINGEKPMLDFLGKPMVERVLDALLGAESISKVFVAVSHNTPTTEAYIRQRKDAQTGRIAVIKTPGKGYVEDLLFSFRELGLLKAFITCSDLPMITPSDVDFIVEEYRIRGGSGSMAVLVPLSLVNELGFTPNYPMGENSATGLNIVNMDTTKKSDLLTHRVTLAANINVQSDLEVARMLLRRKA